MSKTKGVISAEKLIAKLNTLINDNYKTIDEDMDGDDCCKHEVDTLENIIVLIESGECDETI